VPTSYSEGEVTVEGGECSREAGKSGDELDKKTGRTFHITMQVQYFPCGHNVYPQIVSDSRKLTSVSKQGKKLKSRDLQG